MTGKVEQILVADRAGTPMLAQETAELRAGKGLVGDRYCEASGTFSEQLAGQPDAELTLIEQEQISAFNTRSGHRYSGADFRRNIVTSGIDLNALVGREFRIGAARLRGIRLCEPCAHLAAQLGPAVVQQMVHRCGLRAQILDGATILVADPVVAE